MPGTVLSTFYIWIYLILTKLYGIDTISVPIKIELIL